REVTPQGALQDVRPPVELAHLFSFAHHRAVAGRGIKRGDARAARAEALRKSALRIEFHLELSFEHELLEKLILTDVSLNPFFHLPLLQQQTNAEIVQDRKSTRL